MAGNDTTIDKLKPLPDELPVRPHKSPSIASTSTTVTFLDVQLSDKSEAESSSDLECARRKRISNKKAKHPRGHRRKQLRTCTTSSLLMAIVAILALLVAAVGLWPSISSQSDSKKSIALAQWEAEKDFLEFCENHSWNTTACKPVKNVTLPVPPGSWTNNTWTARHAELKMPLFPAPDVERREEGWRRGS